MALFFMTIRFLVIHFGLPGIHQQKNAGFFPIFTDTVL
jgi:hypothetical protein